jgi:lambda family phage portal protein
MAFYTRPLRSVGKFFLQLTSEQYQGAERYSAWAKRWRTSKARRADEEILLDRPVLVERSRSLYRNNAIGRAAITTHLYNSVGRGFTLNTDIDALALGMTTEQKNQWESTTERAWANYANSTECDVEGQMTWHEMTGLVSLTRLIDGEAFAVLKNIPRMNHVYSLRCKLVDTSIITNPRGVGNDFLWRDGVRLDINGRPVAYWLEQPDLTGYEVPAFGYTSGRKNVLHIFRKEFPGQSRGVPFLSGVMRELRKLEEYTKAELESAVVAAMFTAFVKSTDNAVLDSPITTADGGPAVATDEYSLGPAAIMHLQPGEDVTFANPGRPNTGFAQYVDFMVKIICAGLNLSYETVMKTFQSSYSATKGAQNETRKFFAVEKQWISNRWCQPFYEEWLTEEIIAGRIDAPGFLTSPAIRRAYCGAQWIGETTGSVDLKSELEASEMLIAAGYSNRQREAAQFTGLDWYENQKVLKQERTDAAPPPAEPAEIKPGF